MKSTSRSRRHHEWQCLSTLARGANANLDEAREAVRRIIRDGHRAGDVIQQVRALLKKLVPEKLGSTSTTSFRRFSRWHTVSGQTSCIAANGTAAGLPPVLGDRIQLQQVILNLVMNGMEALSSVADRSRELLIRSGTHEPQSIFVAVRFGIGLDSRRWSGLSTPSLHQAEGDGHGAVDQPLDRRGARRPVVGYAERRSRRDLSVQPARGE